LKKRIRRREEKVKRVLDIGDNLTGGGKGIVRGRREMVEMSLDTPVKDEGKHRRADIVTTKLINDPECKPTSLENKIITRLLTSMAGNGNIGT